MSAIILHGICDSEEYYKMNFPSPSNAHWLPWLQQKFLRAGTLCQKLEMPTPYKPNYEKWRQTFEQLNINEKTLIVGHSAGCGFILKWLNQNVQVKISKLVLVAPYLDPFNEYGDFIQETLNTNMQNRVKSINVLYSTDERVEGVLETKDIIMETYPSSKLHTFTDKGHFCFSDIGSTFPELWEICNK